MAERVSRIVLVEDDSEIRKGFQMMIDSSTSFEVIGSFASAEEAMLKLQTLQPDIMLMDIELPGINGIEAVGKIKETYPNIEIVMVTVYEDTDLVFDALKAGASGYITKSSSYEKLLSGLEEVSQGGAPMSINIARKVISSLHINRNSPLTKRETTILQLLSDGKSYHEISETLFISRDTVKTHLKHIYAKLYVKSRAEAVAKANKEKLI